jgi:hypothetical protein
VAEKEHFQEGSEWKNLSPLFSSNLSTYCFCSNYYFFFGKRRRGNPWAVAARDLLRICQSAQFSKEVREPYEKKKKIIRLDSDSFDCFLLCDSGLQPCFERRDFLLAEMLDRFFVSNHR